MQRMICLYHPFNLEANEKETTVFVSFSRRPSDCCKTGIHDSCFRTLPQRPVYAPASPSLPSPAK